MSKKLLEARSDRRIYREDFKREAVLMYENSGKSFAEICRLLEISSASSLRRWSMLYSKQKNHRGHMKVVKSSPKSSIPRPEHTHNISASNSEDKAKILALEEEVRQLRQVLGTHAVKDYLSELREESWRELTNSSTLQEVEKRVAKKR